MRDGVSALRRESPHEHAHRGEPRREGDEDRTIAEVIGAEAAQHLPHRDAEHLADEEPRKHGLAPLVRHRVADPGHRQRNERAGGRARQHPRDHQRTERRSERAQERRDRAAEGRQRDDPVLAIAIADRPVRELQQAVGDGECGDGLPCRADADAEFGGEVRKHRIADSQRGGRAAGAEGERDDGPHFDAARVHNASRSSTAHEVFD